METDGTKGRIVVATYFFDEIGGVKDGSTTEKYTAFASIHRIGVEVVNSERFLVCQTSNDEYDQFLHAVNKYDKLSISQSVSQSVES